MSIEQIIQKASRNGLAAQATLRAQETSKVDFENDRLKSAESSQRTEIQLRVIKDGKVGLSSTTDPNDVDGVVNRALEAAEFGSPATWLAERDDILAPTAAGLVPGIKGLHVGLVVKLDGDPDQEHRVQVSVPTAGVDHVWARLMQFHASNTFGAFFLPEIGDEVVLGWFDDDPAHPVVLGSLYSAKNVPPQPLEAANNIKTIVTRCQASLSFDDENKVITVKTPAGNVVVLSDKDKSITLTDQNGNKVELGSGGVTVDSPKDIKLSAKGSISIDAVGALSLSSKADVKLAGLNVNATAQVGLVAKGSATAELSASGQTTVKGAMVMIN